MLKLGSFTLAGVTGQVSSLTCINSQIYSTFTLH